MTYGYTWEYIDDFMTLPRLRALNLYEAQHPPLHLIMAAYAGYKPKPELPNSKQQLIEEFTSMGLTNG